MSYLLRRAVARSQQPGGIVGGAPHSALQFLITQVNGVPTDLVNGNVGSYYGSGNPGPVVVQEGVAAGLNVVSASSQYAALAHNPAYTDRMTGPITLFWAGYVVNTAQYNFFLATATANGALNNPFELRNDYGNQTVSLVRAGSYSYATYNSGISIIQVGKFFVLAVTSDGVAGTSYAGFYINGALVSSTVVTAPGVTTNSKPMLLGTRDDYLSYARTKMVLAAGFNKVLDPQTILAYSTNIWSMARGLERTVRLGASALYPTLSNMRFNPATPTGGYFAVDLS
jgi:hypothetical protein